MHALYFTLSYSCWKIPFLPKNKTFCAHWTFSLSLFCLANGSGLRRVFVHDSFWACCCHSLDPGCLVVTKRFPEETPVSQCNSTRILKPTVRTKFAYTCLDWEIWFQCVLWARVKLFSRYSLCRLICYWLPLKWGNYSQECQSFSKLNLLFRWVNYTIMLCIAWVIMSAHSHS